MNYEFIKNLAYFLLANPIRIKLRSKSLGEKNIHTVLNLHRVSPDQTSTFEPLDTQLFDDFLFFCKKHFTLTNFKDLDGHQKSLHKQKKPLLTLSFDDGYKDFIKYAMPILEKHKISVNQNIIPGCVETGLPPFNVLIQDFISQAPNDLLKSIKIPGFLIDQTSNRAILGYEISKFLKNRAEDSRKLIIDEVYPQIFNFEELKTAKMMTIEDLKECKVNHEIGLHSYSHASMNFETDDFFEQDLINCKSWYETNLQSTPEIYAFPNGSYRKSQIDLTMKHSFCHILLVGNAYSKPHKLSHSRFSFHANTKSEMIFRTFGALKKIS